MIFAITKESNELLGYDIYLQNTYGVWSMLARRSNATVDTIQIVTYWWLLHGISNQCTTTAAILHFSTCKTHVNISWWAATWSTGAIVELEVCCSNTWDCLDRCHTHLTCCIHLLVAAALFEWWSAGEANQMLRWRSSSNYNYCYSYTYNYCCNYIFIHLWINELHKWQAVHYAMIYAVQLELFTTRDVHQQWSILQS